MNTQETRIQVIFRVDTKKGTYQDALWFTQEEYSKLAQTDIDKMKQERIDNWIKVVSTPAPELTDIEKVAQIQSEVDRLSEQIQELQTQKAEITKIK